jgi:hypothetical protein
MECNSDDLNACAILHVSILEKKNQIKTKENKKSKKQNKTKENNFNDLKQEQ